MRRNTIVALLTGALVVGGTFWPSPASAQGRRGRVIVTGGFGYGYRPFFYDPFWGPYPYYGYGAYPIGVRSAGEVRVLATPKQADVFVDGFYAGVVDDFDGTFQRLHMTPGGHAITLHLEGYRTVTQNVYVAPDQTLKLQLAMDRLRPGEASDPVPIPARPLSTVSVDSLSLSRQSQSAVHTSVDPARDELQLAAALNLEDQVAVGLDAIHQHSQAVDAPHRVVVHRVDDIAGGQRHLVP